MSQRGRVIATDVFNTPYIVGTADELQFRQAGNPRLPVHTAAVAQR
jgi:hypothetical protein